ncbi:GNAT family N-acetyltransferase [Neobacillus muris]|uniref:GNAT family N-acetyltransferase n=1 Tax=Neobacillus muris TaxID=2941334 RepID=UPI0020422FD2|nr:GNAT family N-acetyltransferase [Neobacillus muris]
MNYRRAAMDDIDRLIDLRKLQLLDEGIEPAINIDTELHQFFLQKLEDGSLIQWVAEEKEEIIACGAVIFYDFPPSYTNKTGKRAYITNMYTHENFRGQGIATHLLKKLVEESKEAGVTKMWLGASNLGRPVYQKFGFKETDEYLELNL